jgi:GT2 family glycosyltransferase
MELVKYNSITSIAVLITCHNRKVKTISCLKALFDQSGLGNDFQIEVFIVDDGSTDGTSDVIRAQFPDVNIIQGTGNLFWNRGMHLAWKIAYAAKDFDYYLWLNDDTFLNDNAILDLISGATKTNMQSAICGSTFSLKLQKISYGGNSNNGNLLLPNGELQEVFTFNGNVVLIPKFVFLNVGNLDKTFPHAIGDFDYSLRIRKIHLKSFISGIYVGTCEGSDKLPIWCSENVSFRIRLYNLYSPLGNSHPFYYFIFSLKHYGLFIAFKHFFTIHLRLFFPKLWL